MEIIAVLSNQDTKHSIGTPFPLSDSRAKNGRKRNILIGICRGENCKSGLTQNVD